MSLIRDITFGLVIGVIPALIWLWFWLKEDKKKPEPKGRLILTFIGGALAVLIVLPFEELIANSFSDVVTVFLLWAGTEELTKFLLTDFIALKRKECDEPIDPMIYMITAALGFSALENAFFVVSSLNESGVIHSFSTGNLRFIGATLLHVLTSGTIGLFMSLSFYHRQMLKIIFLSTGIVLAVLIHARFNLSLVQEVAGLGMVAVFAFVWILLVVLLIAFEKIKRVKAK
jgi:RsiW-degrading membrane proteinase PrsW (M82 family)